MSFASNFSKTAEDILTLFTKFVKKKGAVFPPPA